MRSAFGRELDKLFDNEYISDDEYNLYDYETVSTFLALTSVISFFIAWYQY